MRYVLLMPGIDPIYRVRRMVDRICQQEPKDFVYEPVWEGEVFPGPGETVINVLGFIWQRHNVGDNQDGNRPLARECRSMCSGDLVLINGELWLCDSVGWVQLTREQFPKIEALHNETVERFLRS